jgi:hypothetical protein
MNFPIRIIKPPVWGADTVAADFRINAATPAINTRPASEVSYS